MSSMHTLIIRYKKNPKKMENFTDTRKKQCSGLDIYVEIQMGDFNAQIRMELQR